MAGKGRCMGGKRCVRRSVSLSNEYDAKLNQLAVSCNMPPATLASLILELNLDSPHAIRYLQDRYNTNPKYEVIPVIQNGKVTY